MKSSRKKGVPSDWLRHLPNELERAEFEKTLRHSRSVFTRLQDILVERMESIDRVEASPESYKEAGWAYQQAHLNGKRSELQALLNLIEFIDG
jgi:hypothetical protein